MMDFSVRRYTCVLTSCMAIAALSSGCTKVAPYERAKLAHPTMALTHGDGPGSEHLHGVTEGAVGGTTGAGSGCGCN
jgi:hypothetical protein